MLRANEFVRRERTVDEAIGQWSDTRLEALKRVSQFPKAAPSFPDLRRQPWVVRDEAGGEPSHVQPRAKRRCRCTSSTAGLSIAAR